MCGAMTNLAMISSRVLWNPTHASASVSDNDRSASRRPTIPCAHARVLPALAPARPAAPQSRAMPSHQHAHDHTNERGRHDTAFAVGTLLNAAFVVVEGAYGLIGHSMALLADAGHNLSDVAALLIAWAASALARQRPSTRFTYVYRGSSILAALLNAVILFIAVGAIGLESVQRLIEPAPVASLTVIV